jgi:hypothetical protein
VLEEPKSPNGKPIPIFPILCTDVSMIGSNILFLLTSKDSVYTYETMTVEYEEENVQESTDDMVGVEVQVEEEEQPTEQRKVASLKPMSLYLSELKTVLEQNNRKEDVLSPSNYYDATSPSAFDQGEPDSFFQGSESIPIVQDEGYYDTAEETRYRKIQALNGTGWQGPIDEDYSL